LLLLLVLLVFLLVVLVLRMFLFVFLLVLLVFFLLCMFRGFLVVLGLLFPLVFEILISILTLCILFHKMVTVSQVVRKLVRDKPFLQEALSRGIINHASLAESFIPVIEKELGKSVK